MNKAVSLPKELSAPYQGYAYTYPHKSAYRAVVPPKSLKTIWADEPLDRRFLYVHIPFCEMRCGFCNLFTVANPSGDLETNYLTALRREAEVVSQATQGQALPPVQIAMGGGTPTFLQPEQLAEVFDIMAKEFQATPTGAPTSIETSPKTATMERLQLIHERGVQRVSIGVQSFVEDEVRAMGRPQKTTDAIRSLDNIRTFDFPVLNLDLIYGSAEQTTGTWVASIKQALTWQPEEIYLYPLYVRPRTGLDGRASVWDDHRLMLYRAGRDYLLEQGYDQISMRHFRKPNTPVGASDDYACQEDGMIGLGPGARSYTRDFHYAMDFAVSRASVLRVLKDYTAKNASDFAVATHGITLDQTEKMRRYVLKSILRNEGLDRKRFDQLYACDPLTIFPELDQLRQAGLLTSDSAVIRPTMAGLERSDAIAPWLYSTTIAARMAAFETT